MTKDTLYNPQAIESKWPHSAKASRGKQDEFYNPQIIEKKWQDIWEKVGLNKTDLKGAQKPFYNLMMYPYPSAEGLHVGNVYAFTGADIYGRFKKMSGFDVFEPIGFDSGGIHSENYAIQVGIHPKIQVPKNVKNFSKQLHQIGCMYDWDHTVDAMDPEYYKWTQWIFVQLFKGGLAYKKKAPVTWCPSCKTTLSDEQTEEKAGVRVCERCKTEITKKELEQWFFRITKYAKRLLENTKKLDWTEKVLIAQRNWIGKSEGAEVTFKVKSQKSKVKSTIQNLKVKESEDLEIKVFTTRPDTLFGCTFFCLAPEHPLVDQITTKENKKEVSDYVTQALRKNEQQRKFDEKDKTGVFTGGYVINPANNEKVPVWVADYVLMDYGGGAVMGVPAHDERDWQFAKKYGLKILDVCYPEWIYVIKRVYEEHPEIKNFRENPTLASGLSTSIYDYFEAVRFLDKNREEAIKYALGRFSIPDLSQNLPPADPKFEFKLIQSWVNEEIHRRVSKEIKKLGDIKVIWYTKEIQEKLREIDLGGLSEQILVEEILDTIWKFGLKVFDKGSLFKRLGKAYSETGFIVNSKPWNSWQYPKDLVKVIGWLEQNGFGKKTVQYKIRDWCISRQRYWGPPIPMIYCPKCAKEGKSWYDKKVKSQKSKVKSDIENCKLKIENSADMAGWYPVPEDQLPVLLPDTDDYLPGEAGGKAPLARLPEFVKTKCPKCGGQAERETDVSDTFLDSSWYYLRYPSVGIQNSKVKVKNYNSKLKKTKVKEVSAPWDEEITQEWLPVDQYTGGAEHSVLHLLYSRFITMALHELGYLDFDEPFPHFYAHGMIIKDGAKMSKSRGNIVNPDEYIEKFGADALRCYLMFLGPFNQGGDFRDTGMIGMYKFLAKIYRFCQEKLKTQNSKLKTDEYSSKEEAYWANKTIKKVGEDLAKFKYNTAIAAIMEYVNYLSQKSKVPPPLKLRRASKSPASAKATAGKQKSISKKALKALILVLAPFTPHLTEELWQMLATSNQQPATSKNWKLETGNWLHSNSIHSQPWPKYDPKLYRKEKIVIVVQVNGKVREKLKIDTSQSENKEQLIKLAKQSKRVHKYLKGKKIKKTVFVKGRLVNFAV